MTKAKQKKTNVKYKRRNANKQKGLILRSFDTGLSFFRIYNSRGGFKDYEIVHDDLAVQILDKSAEFLESTDGTRLYLDYSQKVLGPSIKPKQPKKKPSK